MCTRASVFVILNSKAAQDIEMADSESFMSLELDSGVDADLTNDVASLRAVLNETAPSKSPGKESP